LTTEIEEEIHYLTKKSKIKGIHGMIPKL